MLQQGDDILLAFQSEDGGSDSTTLGQMSETSVHTEQHQRLRMEFEERCAALLDCMNAMSVSETRTRELTDSGNGDTRKLDSDFIEPLLKKLSPPPAHSAKDVVVPAQTNDPSDPTSAEPGHACTSSVEFRDSTVPFFTPAPVFNLELIDAFDGNKDDYGTWEAKTEIVMNAYADPAWRTAILTALPSRLKGDAASWLVVRWKTLQEGSDSRFGHPSWEAIRDDMRRHFRRPDEEAEGIADDLDWDFLGAGKESAATYLTSKLARYRAMAECPSEERLVAKIRAGMPENLQNFVPTSIKTVDDIVDLLISQEPVWRRNNEE